MRASIWTISLVGLLGSFIVEAQADSKVYFASCQIFSSKDGYKKQVKASKLWVEKGWLAKHGYDAALMATIKKINYPATSKSEKFKVKCKSLVKA